MGRSRHAVRLASLLAIGLLLCGMGSPANGARPQGAVDLYLIRGGTALIPGGAAERGLTVVNNGRDMAGEIELFYTTPIFVTIDAPLPAGCAVYFQGQDGQVPSVVKCTLGPLRSGQAHELSLPIAISADAPPVVTYGTAIARPARPDLDPERNLLDNIATPGGTIALAPGALNRADGPVLAVTSSTTLVSGNPTSSDFRVRNLGNADADNTRLIVVTPLYVNTSTAGDLPPGCSMLLHDVDPAVPEIVDCSLDTVASGQTKELRIPVRAVAGAPHGRITGAVIASAGRLTSSVGPADVLVG